MPTKRNRTWVMILGMIGCLALAGCGTEQSSRDPEKYFTSGNREADQRAEQRIAQNEQLKGNRNSSPTLYERLGGEPGIRAIMDDFVPRVLADPRANWARKGVGRTTFHAAPREWEATPEQLELLKKHLGQFVAVATGGPARYEGRGMKEAHRGLKITNVEFDASIGDLKATLDKLGVAIGEQKELLAIFESTRTQIVEVR